MKKNFHIIAVKSAGFCKVINLSLYMYTEQLMYVMRKSIWREKCCKIVLENDKNYLG